MIVIVLRERTKDTWTGETLFEMRRGWGIEGIVNDAEQGWRLMGRVIGTEQHFRHGRMVVVIVRGGSMWDICRGEVIVLVKVHGTSGTGDHVHHDYGLDSRETNRTEYCERSMTRCA